MGGCKGRHLEKEEWYFAMILRGLGFSTRTIAEVLGVHHESLNQRYEILNEKIMKGDLTELRMLASVIELVVNEREGVIGQGFWRLYNECRKIRDKKRRKFRRREEEIIDTTIRMLI